MAEISVYDLRRLAAELRATADALDVMADAVDPDARLHYRDDSVTIELARIFLT